MPPSDLALRRAALRAALAVSTLSGAVACTTDAPVDELWIAVDASPRDTHAADAPPADTVPSPDTGLDTAPPPDVFVDTAVPPADTVAIDVPPAACGEADGICPSGCDPCYDPDCCEQLEGGAWVVETWGDCSQCFGSFCFDQACCEEMGCGDFVGVTTYTYCAAGGCAIPGPFRPPAVRV